MLNGCEMNCFVFTDQSLPTCAVVKIIEGKTISRLHVGNNEPNIRGKVTVGMMSY